MGFGSDDTFSRLAGLADGLLSLFEDGPSAGAAGPGRTHWTPPVDVYDTGEAFVMVAEVPGLEQEAIRAEVQGGTLVLQGERPLVRPAEGRSYHRIERPSGSFRRVFRLPDDVDPDAIRAVYRDGILEVTIPRARRGTPVRVEVED
ncbi:MAG: Hsp20/alpha crystallin family protein [Candidatus Dadabacteria bacterium]|nr:MAG: Hsp20/alpha crystallin family protein [Candidatus Dadabacteria bacterium]